MLGGVTKLGTCGDSSNSIVPLHYSTHLEQHVSILSPILSPAAYLKHCLHWRRRLCGSEELQNLLDR